MRVSKTELEHYIDSGSIAHDCWFKTRTGNGQTSEVRDKFFLANTARLFAGLYCAIGSDEDGWELDRYNGINWELITPDPSYSLVVTSDGLKALANRMHGGFNLKFTGVKILNNTLIDNTQGPLTSFTDQKFMNCGTVTLSVGTNDSVYNMDAGGTPYLSQILSWKYNTSRNGLQYRLHLPVSGFGSYSDRGEDEWEIGSIGLYVKDPNDGNTDVLFAVASLPTKVIKYNSTLEIIGNEIDLYFNMVLTNLGVVTDLSIVPEEKHSIAEFANESYLYYPSESIEHTYNMYLIDNYNGTGVPAIAVPRITNDINGETITDWVFFHPTDNKAAVTTADFDTTLSTGIKGYILNNKAYNFEGTQIGTVDSNGNVLDFNGQIIGKTRPSNYKLVRNLNGQIIGYRDETGAIRDFSDTDATTDENGNIIYKGKVIGRDDGNNIAVDANGRTIGIIDTVNIKLFDGTSEIPNYAFVYWDFTENCYKLAEGMTEEDQNKNEDNPKMPVGIRVGNSIVFSGEVQNNFALYNYKILIASTGSGYAIGEYLNIPVIDNSIPDLNLTFKIQVSNINSLGGITSFVLIGPTNGNIEIPNASDSFGDDEVAREANYAETLTAHNGRGATFYVHCTKQDNIQWNFGPEYWKKPVYCGKGEYAGQPVLEKNDSFIGWCTGPNSIRLALDLRNEASYKTYGTTRYADNSEVKECLTNSNAAFQTAVTPKELQANYFQKTKPANARQEGSKIENPVRIDSFTKFNNIILGSGVNIPNSSHSNTPWLDDAINAGVSFYGTAFRAWYADLAEFYRADKFYEPGTLITFGKGTDQITIATEECNGVISKNPGYQLGIKEHELDLPVALVGKVPVLMDGNCIPKFGDKIYLSKIKYGHGSTIPNGKCIGKIIDKYCNNKHMVECVVRIDF